jgi:hypothetical protein
MERFNHKTLNKIKRKEVEILNMFVALEHIEAEVEIHSAWETIRENMRISTKESIGYYELKKHMPWFDERWSKLFDQRE